MQNTRIKKLQNDIEVIKEKLASHPLYDHMSSLDDLRIFMAYHVFAVWDFMSVLKVLQQQLTYMHIPWVPEGCPDTRYLINQIVLEEESDLDNEGKRTSHFELYLNAMKQAGADTSAIDRLITNLKSGNGFPLALAESKLPDAARSFIKNTIETSISSNKIHAQAAVFTFGRREFLPIELKNLVVKLSQEDPESLSIMKYYIDLHPKKEDQLQLAIQMTVDLCGEDDEKWIVATNAITRTLDARIKLHDAILDKIKAGKSK
ncbi:DUF3050 domain-containing protein [Aurantibacillus circumpalustris]|uniref:DUF3050 domain-containing protein n=1 Tax=Aurantibacillus circumpalustris TaxID=3036359 RepID=UPI00295B9A0A|nr:DUF3050 domain-containing protein [Aurantibacillus circumpalustris]